MTNKGMMFSVFVFFAGIYFFFSIGHFGGDGYEDYLTAESIVLDRNLELYDRPGDTDELKYLNPPGIKGPDGSVYSSRGTLVVPVLLSLFYAAGNAASVLLKQVPHDYVTMFFCSFYNPSVSALNALLVFIISLRLRFRMSTAFMLSLVYGTATMAPVYARTGFSEPTMIMFMLISVYFLLRYSEDFRISSLFAASCAAALTVLTKSAGSIFIPCFVVYVMLANSGRKNVAVSLRETVLFVMFLLVILFPSFLTNYLLHGSWASFGTDHSVAEPRRIFGAEHMLKGLYYYLFSTGKGIFFFNPPVLLSFAALYYIFKSRRKEGILFFSDIHSRAFDIFQDLQTGLAFFMGAEIYAPDNSFSGIDDRILYRGEQDKNIKGVVSGVVLYWISVCFAMYVRQSVKILFFRKRKTRDR